MKNLFIGTSGFSYSHWRGNFYPQDLKSRDFLSFYAQHFPTVEINSSFYHLLQAETVKNRVKKVPQDFLFSFKMSRFITHVKKLLPDKESFEKFFSSLKILEKEKKKHLILIQTPPFLQENQEKLKAFLSRLPLAFLYAFEFRHTSWFKEKIYRILREYNAALVLSDNPGLWPCIDVETASFCYFRFHGSKRLFASSYTEDELQHYARLIGEKVKKGLEVFAYFNNDAEGWAVVNARTLTFLVKSLG